MLWNTGKPVEEEKANEENEERNTLYIYENMVVSIGVSISFG